jgi:hypothetical protein
MELALGRAHEAQVPSPTIDQAIDSTLELASEAGRKLEVDVTNGFTHLYSADQDRKHFKQEQEILEELATWLLGRGAIDTNGQAARWLHASREHGPIWLQACDAAVHAAKTSATEAQSRWALAYWASWAGWVISFLLLGEAGGLAFVMWAASFVTWLLARTRREVTPDWAAYLQLSSINPGGSATEQAPDDEPPEAEVEGAKSSTAPPAWHPDPMGRHELRYWGGESWTEYVSNGGTLSNDRI